MILHCPNCERAGNLPDQLADRARRLRCRGCNERFWALPLRPGDGPLGAVEAFARSPELRPAAAVPQVLQHEFFSSDDEDGLSPARDLVLRGPEDSHYELSAVFDEDANDGDESQVDLPAFSTESVVPDDVDATASLAPAGADISVVLPWYYIYIQSWARFHFLAALGFTATSLLLLGYLLVRSLAGGPIIHPSITALLVGCVGTIAFLLLSLSMAAVVALLADLGRSVRTMNLHAARNLRSVGEPARRNRPTLSRSVG
jgi:hypothetical protein